MTTIALFITYLGCLSSGTMLSMLLLLVGAYISASLWLINQGVIYTGLLYILVYVGAIVVLIMFVVQLTNTSLSGDSSSISQGSPLLILIQNSVLIICLTILMTSAYHILNSHLILNLSYFNLTDNINSSTNSLTSHLESYMDYSTNGNNLSLLAFSIFNEYAYILIISVHAIILAIIGPIKLALSDLS